MQVQSGIPHALAAKASGVDAVCDLEAAHVLHTHTGRRLASQTATGAA